MENFKKELNELLLKYQDLPEFTLKIRPRIIIEEYQPIKSNQIYNPPTNSLSNDPYRALEAKITPQGVQMMKQMIEEQNK